MIKENKAQATGKGGSLADRLDELTGDTAQAASSDKSKSGNDPAPNPKTPPPLPTSTPAAESAQKSKPPKPPVRPASSPPSSPPKNAGNAKGNKAQSARPPKPPTPPGKQGSPAQSKPIDALKAAAAPKSPSASQPASPPKPPSKTSGKASVPPPIPGKSRSTPGPRPDPIKKSGLDVDSASVPDAIRPKDRPAPDQPGTAAPETRRPARRRPAGPSRERIAANDDAPSIGGLIYALNQKPSNKPFVYASAGSGIWAALAAGFAYGFILRDVSFEGGLAGLVSHPSFLTAFATLVGPIVLFWFLAFLSWRIEELHLRSTAMTEVAVRLAEPDRMAEQSVASLGQAVRRQVSFMNDAVSRALGRAGELEALVHNEVSTLEQSYEENERKIRGLIQELAGERHALLNTGDRFRDTLSQLGTEVPQLIEKLGHQQLKLATIIEGAGANLSQLETALTGQTNRLESTLDGGAGRLQSVLEDYTGALAVALGSRTDQMQAVLGDYTETMGGHAASMQTALEDQRTNIEKMFADNREVVDTSAKKLDETLSNRTETMQIVFEEYARAMDTMLSNRTDDIDSQLVQRIKALDDAFSERLQLFDETVMKSAMSVDDAIGRNSGALTSALETHARDLGDTLAKQAEQLDHTLATRIEAVRSSSENISKQSIKAIEGLAGQSDLLRTVSENLLSQINNVSNRFENQGQAILQSANALESANVKIDKMLSRRSNELNDTLDLMSSRANELGQAVQGYSSTLEGSVSQAERRARMLTQDLTRQTQERARSTVDDLQRLKDEARKEADRALDDLKSEFATVSREVTERLGSLSSQFSQTTGEVRAQAARAAQQLEDEQGRLRQQMERLPGATEESAAAMRKALRDQLKALDQLSSLAVRTAHESAASPPVNQQPIPLQEAPPPQEHGDRGDTAATSRDANSLTNTLQRELHQPHAPDVTRSATNGTPRESTPRRAVASLAGDKGERSGEDGKWSFGDLLARASDEDPQAVPAEPREAQSSPDSDGGLDIAAIAGALDRTTAAAIWTRFRSGQRGFMVRSIYAHDSRELYDDVVYRYQYKPAFRENVNRFLLEFEQVLRDLDRQDGSGELTQEHIIADTGRVYLLLAHAAKRLV